jgi:hypothetical protein
VFKGGLSSLGASEAVLLLISLMITVRPSWIPAKMGFSASQAFRAWPLACGFKAITSIKISTRTRSTFDLAIRNLQNNSKERLYE